MIHSASLFVCVAAVASSLALPGVAHAQDEAFRQGLRARGDKKWMEVVTQMRRAIQADPEESARKVGGGLLGLREGTEYLPRYFIGEALFNLNDCGGAVDSWSMSEQVGIVRRNREFFDVIQKGYAVCASKGVLAPRDYNPLLVSTRQALADVTALAQQVSDFGKANPAVWRNDVSEPFERARGELQTAQARLTAATRTRTSADFAEAKAAAERAAGMLRPLEANLTAAVDNLTLVQRQAVEIEQLIAAAETTDRSLDANKAGLTRAMAASRQSGREGLARARERLKVAEQTQNPATVNEALSYAQEASTALGRVAEQLKKQARDSFEVVLREAAAGATEAFSFADSSFATLERFGAEKPALVRPEMAGERESLQKQMAALRRRLEAARKSESVAGLQETARLATEIRAKLDALIASFGPLSLRDRGVHAALEEGARLFFGGEYQMALTALDPAQGLGEVPLQLHVHLFRAASLYALHIRSGETDQPLLTQAIAETQRCKELSPAFQPDPRVFAPRFIAFYRKENTQAKQDGTAPASQR